MLPEREAAADDENAEQCEENELDERRFLTRLLDRRRRFESRTLGPES
jgi:hypothetical protein